MDLEVELDRQYRKKELKSQINTMRAGMKHEVLSTLGVCPLVDRRKEGQLLRGKKCCGTYFYRYEEYSGCENPDCMYDTYCANRMKGLLAEYMELLGDDEEEFQYDDVNYTPVDQNVSDSEDNDSKEEEYDESEDEDNDSEYEDDDSEDEDDDFEDEDNDSEYEDDDSEDEDDDFEDEDNDSEYEDDDSEDEDNDSEYEDEGIGREMRSVAIFGIWKRRKTDMENSVLDRQLDDNMGTSAEYYMRTKSGKRRREYFGR